MSQQDKRRGAVIVAPDHHTHGLIGLLATPVRDKLELTFYPHPYQIDVETQHDFIIVLSLDDLRAALKFYDAKRLALPLIVHIGAPDTIRSTRHDILFPGVKVLPIPQAGLDVEPGVTLEIGLFAKVFDLLDETDQGTDAPDEESDG